MSQRKAKTVRKEVRRIMGVSDEARRYRKALAMKGRTIERLLSVVGMYERVLKVEKRRIRDIPLNVCMMLGAWCLKV